MSSDEGVYTKEEYALLAKVLIDKHSYYAGFILNYLEKPENMHILVNGTSVRRVDFCTYLRVRAPEMYRMMFEIPFDQTPLYINYTSNDRVMKILKWRWDIGK